MRGKKHYNTKGIFECPILSVKNLVGDIYLIRMACPAVAQNVVPGQFVNIKVNNEFVPFLRKPFSVCRRSEKEGWIEILWKIVGKGTEIMSRYQRNDFVNIVGPLGRGYDIPPDLQTALLVGGGLGVAPLPFLCEEAQKLEKSVEVFLGAKSENELSMVEAFRTLGVEVYLSTEDGSLGKRGLVTEILLQRLNQMPSLAGVYLYSCGPNPFLQAMMNISEERGIGGEVAIETMMGCGFGICVGCPVRVRNGKAGEGLFKLACLDGPVFNAAEILLDA